MTSYTNLKSRLQKDIAMFGQHTLAGQALAAIEELEHRRAQAQPASEILKLVEEQANDDGLWFQAQTAPEAYLQQQLRLLHEVIENVSAAQSMGGSSDAGSASAGMWIAEAGSRKVEPATSVEHATLARSGEPPAQSSAAPAPAAKPVTGQSVQKWADRFEKWWEQYVEGETDEGHPPSKDARRAALHVYCWLNPRVAPQPAQADEA